MEQVEHDCPDCDAHSQVEESERSWTIMSLDEFRALDPAFGEAEIYANESYPPRGKGTDAGFFQYKVPRPTRGSYTMLCCRACRDVGGERKLCDFSMRWDHWKEESERGYGIRKQKKVAGLGAHKHALPHPTIEQIITRPTRNPQLICPALYEKIAIFAAQRNIALDKIASREFFEILWTAGDFMLKMASDNLLLAESSTSDVLTKVSVGKLRNLIVQTGEAKLASCLDRLATRKFVCVCLDAGQVRRRHWLDFIICHGNDEIPCDIQDTANLDTEQYRERAVQLLQKLYASNIRVACFVGDGLPAQVNALDPSKATSFQQTFHTNRLVQPSFRRVMFFPCWIHRVQLVFKHLYVKSKRDDTRFSKIVDNLHELASRLRKSDAAAAIGALCPAPIETRWLFSYDIARFVWERIQAIREFLGVQAQDYKLALESSYDMHQLLAPLRALTLALSAKAAKACQVVAYLNDVIKRLNQLQPSTPTFAPFKREILTDLVKQTIRSEQGDMLIAAYYMTLAGKKEYNPRSVTNRKGIVVPELTLPCLDRRSREQADLLGAKVADVDRESLEEEDGDDDDLPPQDPENPELSESENGQSIEPPSGTASPHLHKILERGISAWASRMGMKRQQQARAWNQFYQFLNHHITEIPYHELWLTGDEAVWNANSNDGAFSDFAQVAERVVIIPASEISCERAISLQGYIQTKYNGRSKADLLAAKLSHLCI